MKRFYEISTVVESMSPVNTNFPCDAKSAVNLVIVCESPSTDEVAIGFPTVSSTGAKIFNNLVRAEMLESKALTYSFDSHYSDFALNGIYLTNLVRYQADLGIKDDRGAKDLKVRQLWSSNKNQLFKELELINNKYPNSPVLIACGSSFESQIIEVAKKANELGMPWFITSHPSRSKRMYASNYNPANWEKQNIAKTKLMEKIECKLKRS
ncbi:uracil-DNA glycosylase family protein [Vibrio parahaemolyticus]|uniref:uracil-DNA glycosylase family protein n=1 Tax=Vibrio parahaemolyticus TaxID=670 RepID=UPI00081BCF73|nr:uracil-DNA glycosylase family protein [Vibrio parahaemolyticus]EJE4210504.1 hypothetical protein [Vibrio parahaemolyticus]